jgi:N-acetylmuramic acid 6-phosphate etherase
VQEATELPHELAAEALDAANGETKTAIVAVLARVSADEARALLDDGNGSVRNALGPIAPCP